MQKCMQHHSLTLAWEKTKTYSYHFSTFIAKKGNIYEFQQFGMLTCVNSDESVQPPLKLRNSK